jgi:pyridoxal phosphate enzyme (YggS family)
MLSRDITLHYAEVLDRVEAAARRANRRPDEITLVAVTKTWPVEVVLAAYEAGLRDFGENRIEELAEKRAGIEAVLGDSNDIVWHQIGTLQSRKTNLAADQAQVFHALDRLKVARRLARRLENSGRVLPTFLEVNISLEASKSGFACGDWEKDATVQDNVRSVVKTIIELPGLQLQGLMTMAPWGAPATEIRHIFQRTRRLAEWLTQAIPQAQVTQLSMGMSDDFEIAVEEGATHVRIGRALFGSRR